MDTDQTLSALRTLVNEVVLTTAVRNEIHAAVAAALEDSLPAVIRRARLPVYLTTSQLCELTGWSRRKLAYMRAEGKVTYIRRGRTVLFPTAEVEAYLEEGLVPAKSRSR